MSRRSLRRWLWTVTLVPLWAATASASSITCYGSIVLSTLGTEGMAVTIPDGSVTQPAAPISAGGATIGSDPTGAGVASPGAAQAPAANGGSRSSGGGGSSSRAAPTAAQGVPDSSTASPVIAPPPSDNNTSSPPVLTDTKPEIPIETVPPPPIETAVPPVVPTPVPVSSEGTVEIATPSVSDNTVTPAPSDQAPPVDSPEPATLTLLGVAGLGGWLRLRRRK
jgi:hypothetical protein